MATKILTDLALRLSTQSAELEKGLARANKSLQGVEKNTSNLGGQITGGLAKIGGAFFAIGASVETFKKVIGSTQATGDAFEANVQGGKTAIENLASSMATLDFENLIQGFISGYKAGKEYAETLDDIADKQLSLGIIEAQSSLELKKQERILKSSTATAEEKIEAEKKMRDLIGTQNKLQKKIASERVKAEEDLLASRYPGKKLTEEEIKLVTDYVKNYIYLTDAQKKAINEVGESQAKMNKARGAVGAFEEERRVVRTTKAYNDAVLTLDDISKKYAGVADVLNLFTDEQRQQWADLYKAEIQVDVETEELLMKADKGTKQVTKSIDKENKALTTKNEILAKQAVELEKLKELNNKSVIEKVDTSNITPGTGLGLAKAPDVDLNPYAEGWGLVAKNMSEVNLIAGAMTTALGGVESAFVDIFEGAKGSMKALVTVVLEATATIIQAFLAQAIAGLIASQMKKGLLGLVTASVGVSLLMALWKTKVPAFANGGIVSSPTNALVGEYPGAQNNPEVIAPLNKLKTLLGGTGGGTVDRWEIDGFKLVALAEKVNKFNRSY